MRSPFGAVHRGDLRDALALVAAIAVVGASFGALAAAGGVPPLLIVAMSVLVFAGGAQFLVVAVVASGGSVVAAVAAGFLLNLRLLPFGLAVGETVGGGWLARLAGAQLITDETVAFSRARPSGPRARAAFWMCGILLYTAWNLGTVAGMLAGSAVPDPAAFGVDAAFPAGLLALLLPGLRRRDARRVALTAAVVALLATRVLPTGLPVLAGLLGLLVAGTPPAPRSADPAPPSIRRGAAVPRATCRRGRAPRRVARGRPVTWTALVVLAAATYSLRLAGLVLRDRLRLPARVQRYVDLGATALLVALVAVSALLDGDAFAGWARPVGVLVGGLAAWRRAPFVVVVVLAAGTAAGLRALGVE